MEPAPGAIRDVLRRGPGTCPGTRAGGDPGRAPGRRLPPPPHDGALRPAANLPPDLLLPSLRVFVGRARLSGDPGPHRAAAPLCPLPGLQPLAGTAPRSAGVALDGCAHPSGVPTPSRGAGGEVEVKESSQHSSLRFIQRSGGLASFFFPFSPSLPPPSAYTPCVAQCRLIPFPFPDSIASPRVPRAGNNCSRPERASFVSVSVARRGRWACERASAGPGRPLCGLRARAAGTASRSPRGRGARGDRRRPRLRTAVAADLVDAEAHAGFLNARCRVRDYPAESFPSESPSLGQPPRAPLSALSGLLG